MSEDIVYLDLPKIPKDLDQRLLNLCGQIKINHDRLRRNQEFFEPNSLPGTLAAQEYGTEMVPEIPGDILDSMRQIYGSMFDGGMITIVGAAMSIDGRSSVTPPHCDRQRRIGINYLLDLGGDQVETSFYQELRRSNDFSMGEKLLYNQVTPRSKIVLPERTWIAFDAQRYHSVENITAKRFFVSLHLIFNPSFDDFCQKYKHIIKK